MSQNDDIVKTLQQIDALVAYLPVLYAKDFNPIKYDGNRIDENGVIHIHGFIYRSEVYDFFRLVEDFCGDEDDLPYVDIAPILKNSTSLKNTSLDEIKGFLFRSFAGERFCYGFQAHLISDGHIRRVLERLKEIRAQLAAQQTDAPNQPDRPEAAITG